MVLFPVGFNGKKEKASNTVSGWMQGFLKCWKVLCLMTNPFTIFTIALTDKTYFINLSTVIFKRIIYLQYASRLPQIHIYVTDQKTKLILLPLALTEEHDGVGKKKKKNRWYYQFHEVHFFFYSPYSKVCSISGAQHFFFLSSSNYSRK